MPVRQRPLPGDGHPRSKRACRVPRRLERSFMEYARSCEPVATALAGAKRVGKFFGMLGWVGFFREPCGPGWVLVGDCRPFQGPRRRGGGSGCVRSGRRARTGDRRRSGRFPRRPRTRAWRGGGAGATASSPSTTGLPMTWARPARARRCCRRWSRHVRERPDRAIPGPVHPSRETLTDTEPSATRRLGGATAAPPPTGVPCSTRSRVGRPECAAPAAQPPPRLRHTGRDGAERWTNRGRAKRGNVARAVQRTDQTGDPRPTPTPRYPRDYAPNRHIMTFRHTSDGSMTIPTRSTSSHIKPRNPDVS